MHILQQTNYIHCFPPSSEIFKPELYMFENFTSFAVTEFLVSKQPLKYG
jgi:hypothetical protein